MNSPSYRRYLRREANKRLVRGASERGSKIIISRTYIRQDQANESILRLYKELPLALVASLLLWCNNLLTNKNSVNVSLLLLLLSLFFLLLLLISFLLLFPCLLYPLISLALFVLLLQLKCLGPH